MVKTQVKIRWRDKKLQADKSPVRHRERTITPYQIEQFRGIMCDGSMRSGRKRINASLSSYTENTNTVVSQ